MWRILVVEDSPTNMLLAVEILKYGGHTVLEAGTAAAGIALAHSELPDVILMDIHLPDMDGLAAMRLLKAEPATSSIPIIALTASIRTGEGQTMLAAGFDGCLGKPISYKEFLAAVDSVANLHHNQRLE